MILSRVWGYRMILTPVPSYSTALREDIPLSYSKRRRIQTLQYILNRAIHHTTLSKRPSRQNLENKGFIFHAMHRWQPLMLMSPPRWIAPALCLRVIPYCFFKNEPHPQTYYFLLKGYSTFFLEIGSFYNSPRVKLLSLTFFESIQPISGSGGATFSIA